MSTAFTAAKIVGLTGAAWLSGAIASISLISIPAITRATHQDRLPASHAVKLWRHNFTAGFALAPPAAVVTAASLAFCAWTARSASVAAVRGGQSGRLFWVAAALTVGIVPYTVLLMKGTNDRLLQLAKKAEREELEGVESEESGGLLRRWEVLNRVRSLLPLAGAVVAGVAVLA